MHQNIILDRWKTRGSNCGGEAEIKREYRRKKKHRWIEYVKKDKLSRFFFYVNWSYIERMQTGIFFFFTSYFFFFVFSIVGFIIWLPSNPVAIGNCTTRKNNKKKKNNKNIHLSIQRTSFDDFDIYFFCIAFSPSQIYYFVYKLNGITSLHYNYLHICTFSDHWNISFFYVSLYFLFFFLFCILCFLIDHRI